MKETKERKESSRKQRRQRRDEKKEAERNGSSSQRGGAPGKGGGETGAADSKAAGAAPAHAAAEQSTSSSSCAAWRPCASASENQPTKTRPFLEPLITTSSAAQLAVPVRVRAICPLGHFQLALRAPKCYIPHATRSAKKSPAAPYSRALTAIWAKNGHFAFHVRCEPPVLSVVVL